MELRNKEDMEAAAEKISNSCGCAVLLKGGHSIEDASDLLSHGVDDIITDKPEMVQQLMNADADLDNDLLFIRDTIRSLIGWFDAGDEPTPEEEVIEEAIEDPEELLDAA